MSWGFPLLIAFVTTPILVHSLGTKKYGEYSIVLSFLAYAFSNGVGKVAGKYIPEYRASDEPDKLSESVSAAFWMVLAVGLLQVIALVSAASFIVADILLIAPESQASVTKALYLAGFSGLILMMGQIFQYALQGVHRFDIFAVITNANALLLSVGNVVIVLLGFGIIPLFIWNLTITTIFGVMFFIKARPLIPEWRLSLKIRGPIAQAVLRYGGSIIIYQLVTNILGVFERSWIVRKFGTETLAFYAVAYMLAVNMHSMLWSFAQVLFPVVNELLTNKQKLIEVYEKSVKLTFLVAAFIISTYICIGRPFFHLWLGSEFSDRSYMLLIFISAAFGFSAIAIVPWLLAEAFRAPGLNALSSTIWTVVGIPLMYLLAERWQVEGIAFARMVGAAAIVPLIFYIEKRFLDVILWRFWLGLLVKIAVAVGAMIFLEKSFLRQFEPGWVALVAGLALGTTVFGVVAFASGLITRQEISLLRSALSGDPNLGKVV